MKRSKTKLDATKKAIYEARKKQAIKRVREERREKDYAKKSFSQNRTRRGRHKSGTFLSRKCNSEFIYRSSYELAFFHMLEASDVVERYVVEGLRVPYLFDGSKRTYIPDVLVLYKDGSMRVYEIKPKQLVNTPIVQAKARACISFLKKHMPETTYHFVTQDEIFESGNDYKKLIRYLNKR